MNAAASGQSDTPKIRDFVYLNQDRIFSYLSQMDGGLKLLFSKVKDEGWSETVSDDEKTVTVGASLEGEAEAKVPLLGGLNAKGSGNWSHATQTGGDARMDYQRDITTDYFGLHHRAFDLIVERLGARLITVTGKIMLIHIDSFTGDIKDFNKIIEAVKKFTRDVDAPPAGLQQMHYLLDRYLRGKVLVIMRTNNGIIYTSYLTEKYFTQDALEIITDFGATPSITFSLTGILAPPQSVIGSGDFTINHFNKDGKTIASQLPQLASGIENMREFFLAKAEGHHIVPVALYSEL